MQEGCHLAVETIVSSADTTLTSIAVSEVDRVAGAHLQLAAVKLQQAPVGEEELAPHSGSSQERRAPQIFLLHLEGTAAGLQYAALVRVGAPAGDSRRTSLHPGRFF